MGLAGIFFVYRNGFTNGWYIALDDARRQDGLRYGKTLLTVRGVSTSEDEVLPKVEIPEHTNLLRVKTNGRTWHLGGLEERATCRISQLKAFRIISTSTDS